MLKNIIFSMIMIFIFSESSFAGKVKSTVSIKPMPPELTTTLKFSEPWGNDLVLGAGEEGKLAITVINTGKGDGFDLNAEINVDKDIPGLIMDKVMELGTVPAGGNVTKELTIKTSELVPTYDLKVTVLVKEADGFNANPSEIAIKTQKMSISFTGPEGMQIRDIIRYLKNGIDEKVIAAKIHFQNGEYKNFSFDEIQELTNMGISNVLIEAMLESTTQSKNKADDLQNKKEMEALLAEIQHMHQKIDELKVAKERQESQQPQSSSLASNSSTESSLGDTLKNCAAQLAALEGCKHLPGLAQPVCRSLAKSQFPCQ